MYKKLFLLVEKKEGVRMTQWKKKKISAPHPVLEICPDFD